MSPINDLVQYIENEAFRGRPLRDILTAVRQAGWPEDLIMEAIAFLNQEHDVLKQIDVPPVQKRKVHKHSKLLIAFISIVSTLVFLMVAGIYKELAKPNYLGFTDPNFIMKLPETWTTGVGYQPAISTMKFYSPEHRSIREQTADKATTIKVYAVAEEDLFGTQLRSGGSGMSIISDKIDEKNGISYRFIQFIGQDPESPGREVRGLYAFIHRGQISMSALVTAKKDFWNIHAEEAEKIVRSIQPKCSRPSLSAVKKDDGTINLCSSDPFNSH